MKTKLIQLTTDSSIGGGSKYVATLLKNLPKGQFECFLISPKGWLAEQYQESDVKNKILNTGHSLSDSINQLRFHLTDIKNSGYPFAPIILHAHSPQAAYIASRAISGLGIYFVYTEHLWTSDYHLKNYFRELVQIIGLRQALRSTSKVITVSKAVERFLISRKIVPSEKIEQVYPVLETKKVPLKKIAKNESKLPISTPIKLGSVGALNAVKGYEYLVSAMAEIREEHPNISLEIIGDGPEEENLKFKVKNLKLSRNIKIINKADSLDKYYQQWDIYLQPSLSESFGLSVFEAMRRGIPVIGSSVGGLAELIDSGENGILVPAKSSNRLAKAIMELVSSRSLMEKLSKGAVKTSKTAEFDFKENFKLILGIYSSLVG